MKLIFSRSAEEALAELSYKEGEALLEKLQKVAADPMGKYPWAEPLVGRSGFRVRQGKWRALYRLDYSTGEMIVDKIDRRDVVYKK